jgi:hypothetical protein
MTLQKSCHRKYKRWQLGLLFMIENKSILFFIHHFTKLAFGLLKRPRASGINTMLSHKAHFYSFAILDFIDQKLVVLHNKFLTLK